MMSSRFSSDSHVGQESLSHFLLHRFLQKLGNHFSLEISHEAIFAEQKKRPLSKLHYFLISEEIFFLTHPHKPTKFNSIIIYKFLVKNADILVKGNTS